MGSSNIKPIILIKTGGKVAVTGAELTSLIKEIKTLQTDYNFILVHGGGAEVTEASKVYGLEAKFIDGVRMTTKPEMQIVDGVLAGRINKRIVRTFETLEVPAVGLSGNDGQIFTGEPIDSLGENRTGKVTFTDPNLLNLLIHGGFTPIICSVSMDKDGNPLNINADEAALAVSVTLKANKVIFLSDIPGILKENEVLKHMTLESIKEEIESGVISGGMIPKVKSSISAIENGVKSVVISNYVSSGDLKQLIENKKGSVIFLNQKTLNKAGRHKSLLAKESV
ncbi:MAG: acetylglutamate kinase [Spirochaetaceae bacterium]